MPISDIEPHIDERGWPKTGPPPSLDGSDRPVPVTLWSLTVATGLLWRRNAGRISLVPTMVTEDHSAVSEILLTDLAPTRRQTRAAIAVVLMAIVAFAVVAPFSGRQAATLNAFFPSLDAIVLVI